MCRYWRRSLLPVHFSWCNTLANWLVPCRNPTEINRFSSSLKPFASASASQKEHRDCMLDSYLEYSSILSQWQPVQELNLRHTSDVD